jgi:DNA invertase Pin-like site-specific DNA recombinase
VRLSPAADKLRLAKVFRCRNGNPHANKLTIQILAAVAQHEREMISERTKSALQAAKARGKVLGNPRLSDASAKGRAVTAAAAQPFC